MNKLNQQLHHQLLRHQNQQQLPHLLMQPHQLLPRYFLPTCHWLDTFLVQESSPTNQSEAASSPSLTQEEILPQSPPLILPSNPSPPFPFPPPPPTLPHLPPLPLWGPTPP